MNYPGEIPTIPSDTSGIFVLPEEPPVYESTGSHIVDWGDLSASDVLAGITVDIPGSSNFDPTYFNPVDTQTIDTSTLGSIAYLPSPDDNAGGNFFASGGGYPGVSGGSDDSNGGNYYEYSPEFSD
jgi:hypothetical protein